MRLKHTLLKFNVGKELRASGAKLRGYIVSRFPEEVLLHQHLGGQFLYSYPKIQYKIINGSPLIVGIGEGAELIPRIASEITELRLGSEILPLVDSKIIEGDFELAEADPPVRYRFFTPWLALNDQNYSRYLKLSSGKKRAELSRILVGNLITMAKGLEYVVLFDVWTRVFVHPVPTSFKRVPLIGFYGEFETNFMLPDFIGLGRSVSRGFGTIERIGEASDATGVKHLWRLSKEKRELFPGKDG
jgi:hypothetical protein